MNIRPLNILVLAAFVGSVNLAQAADSFSVGTSVTNKGLSSGSAMVVDHQGIYVVGDDTPYLFKVNPGFETIAEYPLQPIPAGFTGRMAKKVKPDYESMTKLNWQGRDWMLVLGSGSKKKTREHAVLVSPNGEVGFDYSLKPFYKALYRASGMTGHQKLNIEGLATTGKQAFIFNRGNSGKNMIFVLDQSQFLNFISGKNDSLSSLKVISVKLPEYHNFPSTFSGADYWPQANALVYSASVEGTESAIDDGSVMASYLGVLPLDKLASAGESLDLTNNAHLIKASGKVVPTKVESVALASGNENSAKGYLVSDNDNGTSQFFEFSVSR